MDIAQRGAGLNDISRAGALESGADVGVVGLIDSAEVAKRNPDIARRFAFKLCQLRRVEFKPPTESTPCARELINDGLEFDYVEGLNQRA